MQTRLIALIFVLLTLSGILRAQSDLRVAEQLSTAMIGAFSSAEQAAGDQNFQNTTLHVARISPESTDGVWLYAEQALAGALRHPHKQTVYRLAARPDGSVECRLYDLKDPIAFTGAWEKEALKHNLTPDELTPREGCTVILKPQPDGSFKGITEGKNCPSTLRGATYALTELEVGAKHLMIWERGYNARDRQVWGSLHGGYVFKRSE